MKKYKLKNSVKLAILIAIIITLVTYLFVTRTEAPKGHNKSIKIFEKN